MTKNVHDVSKRSVSKLERRLEMTPVSSKKHRQIEAWHGPCLKGAVMFATPPRSSLLLSSTIVRGFASTLDRAHGFTQVDSYTMVSGAAGAAGAALLALVPGRATFDFGAT
jgi:hypothetical protein